MEKLDYRNENNHDHLSCLHMTAIHSDLPFVAVNHDQLFSSNLNKSIQEDF